MFRRIAITTTSALALLGPGAALATIDNTATVTGTYGASQVTAEDVASVPVSAADPGLSIAKTVGTPTIASGAKADRADAGDTIAYTITITNDGNVTLDGVAPNDPGPTFNGQSGTGTMGGFTVQGSSPAASTASLAPGESAIFEASYTMSDLDVYHAADVTDGVVNTATASGTLPGGGAAYNDPDEAEGIESLPFKAEIALTKTAVLNDLDADNLADKDETITYTYTVTNTGNVPLSGVSVADVHEGANLATGSDIVAETLVSDGPLASGPTLASSTDDGTAGNGIWGVLQPEAVISFTYTHTVTQAEVDGG